VLRRGILNPPERIHVLEIVYSFAVAGPGGGAARFGLELGRLLDKSRFEVTVCGLWGLGTPSERDRIERLHEAGITALSATSWDSTRPYASFWKAVRAMRIRLSQQPAQILHSHSEFGDMAAVLLKAGSGRSLLVRTVHNGYRREWRKRPLRRLLLTNALYPLVFSAEVGVNPSIVRNLKQRWLARLSRRDALYLPNAIDLGRFTNVETDAAQVNS